MHCNSFVEHLWIEVYVRVHIIIYYFILFIPVCIVVPIPVHPYVASDMPDQV